MLGELHPKGVSATDKGKKWSLEPAGWAVYWQLGWQAAGVSHTYDRNSHKAAAVAAATGAVVLSGLTEAAACGRVILAVPDKEVLSCLQEFNAIEQELVVFNVATNVPQTIVENAALPAIYAVCCVKIIGHAGEMALGFDPVIVVNEQPQSLTKVVRISCSWSASLSVRQIR